MANKSFYDFTGYNLVLPGGDELELYREQRGLSGVRTGMVRKPRFALARGFVYWSI
jgi:hypothetical protein